MIRLEELMIGDWVIRKGVPEEHLKVAVIDSNTNIVQLDLDGRGVVERVDGIDPIELNDDILEKNEFYYESNVGQVWNDGEHEVIVDFYNREIRVIENRKQILSLEYFDKIYAHNLQHALKICEVNKEIKL